MPIPTTRQADLGQIVGITQQLHGYTSDIPCPLCLAAGVEKMFLTPTQLCDHLEKDQHTEAELDSFMAAHGLTAPVAPESLEDEAPPKRIGRPPGKAVKDV